MKGAGWKICILFVFRCSHLKYTHNVYSRISAYTLPVSAIRLNMSFMGYKFPSCTSLFFKTIHTIVFILKVKYRYMMYSQKLIIFVSKFRPRERVREQQPEEKCVAPRSSPFGACCRSSTSRTQRREEDRSRQEQAQPLR